MTTVAAFSTTEEIFKIISSINPFIFFGIIAVLAVVLALAFRAKKKKSHYDIKKLVYGALCVALAFVLSYIQFYKLPQGGSITAASMLPILAYGYMFGPGWGTICGIVFSVLQILQQCYYLSPIQFFIEYIAAFTVLGTLSGVFKTKSSNFNLYAGLTLAVVVRYLCHVIAGIIYWGEYAQEGYTAVSWSFLYNAFVLVDFVPCLLLISVPQIKLLFKRENSK